MKEITVKAIIENVEAITDFVNKQLEAVDCSIKAQMQIDIAIDELVSNVAFYAYKDSEEVGDITLTIDTESKPGVVSISFIDGGVPYNPLEKKDPDVTASLEEREIGGLGIFMVKKSMDEMFYEYKDNKNIIKIVKKIV